MGVRGTTVTSAEAGLGTPHLCACAAGAGKCPSRTLYTGVATPAQADADHPRAAQPPARALVSIVAATEKRAAPAARFCCAEMLLFGSDALHVLSLMCYAPLPPVLLLLLSAALSAIRFLGPSASLAAWPAWAPRLPAWSCVLCVYLSGSRWDLPFPSRTNSGHEPIDDWNQCEV